MKPLTALAHPMQPIGDDEGVARFKPNAVIEWLRDSRKIDLNEIAAQGFPDEDMQQFSQLIGYSISGYGDLSFVNRTPEHLHAVDLQADRAAIDDEPLTAEQAKILALEAVVEGQRKVLLQMKALLDEVDCGD